MGLKYFTIGNILILATLIVLIYFLYDYFFGDRVNWTSRSTAPYGNYAPIDRYPEIVSEFGEPDAIDREIGGGAWWLEKSLKKQNKPWVMIAILDEAIPHNKPGPHVDFLYSWMKLDVDSEDKLRDILALSESVSYDPLKKLLQVRCHFMGANLATAVLAKRIALGESTLENILQNDLYGSMIFKTVQSHSTYDPEASKSYEAELMQYLFSR